jgi:hypothetical protein
MSVALAGTAALCGEESSLIGVHGDRKKKNGCAGNVLWERR